MSSKGTPEITKQIEEFHLAMRSLVPESDKDEFDDILFSYTDLILKEYEDRLVQKLVDIYGKEEPGSN